MCHLVDRLAEAEQLNERRATGERDRCPLIAAGTRDGLQARKRPTQSRHVERPRRDLGVHPGFRIHLNDTGRMFDVYAADIDSWTADRGRHTELTFQAVDDPFEELIVLAPECHRHLLCIPRDADVLAAARECLEPGNKALAGGRCRWRHRDEHQRQGVARRRVLARHCDSPIAINRSTMSAGSGESIMLVSPTSRIRLRNCRAGDDEGHEEVGASRAPEGRVRQATTRGIISHGQVGESGIVLRSVGTEGGTITLTSARTDLEVTPGTRLRYSFRSHPSVGVGAEFTIGDSGVLRHVRTETAYKHWVRARLGTPGADAATGTFLFEAAGAGSSTLKVLETFRGATEREITYTITVVKR